MRFSCHDLPGAPNDVLCGVGFSCHYPQVIDVAARPIAAHMVNHHPGRNRANVTLPHVTVDTDRFSTVPAMSISLSRYISLEYVASIGI